MTTTADITIRPFEVHLPEEDLAGLRRHIAAACLPSRALVADRSQGVQLATIQELAATGRPIMTGARERQN